MKGLGYPGAGTVVEAAAELELKNDEAEADDDAAKDEEDEMISCGSLGSKDGGVKYVV